MKPKNVDVFLKALPKDIRAVLFFGPDEGQVRERATALAQRIVPDLNAPFNVIELTSSKVGEDAAIVADELASQSLMGGRRLVRIRDGADICAQGIANAFAQMPPGDSFLIVEAGDLRPVSALRKLFEGAEIAAALACYEGDARDRIKLAEEEFKAAGISATRDALQLLATLLAADRAMARQEIEKLVIYAGPKGRLEYDDIAKAIGDSATIDMDAPAWAAGDGNMVALDRSLTRLYSDGMPTIAILRAAMRHFQRLYAVAGSPDPLPVAMDSLKPPVFWKDKERFASQAGRWRHGQLEKVIQRLAQTEVECKTTGLRDETMCARALTAIASVAARNR